MKKIGDIVPPFGVVKEIWCREGIVYYYMINFDRPGNPETFLVPFELVDQGVEKTIQCIDAIVGD